MEFNSETLQSKLRQAQALISRAEHPNTPAEEAQSARAMAEKLIRKYQLDEEEARQAAVAQGIETIKPIRDDFPMCSFDSEYRDQYRAMMSACVAHVGNVRWAYKYDNGEYVAHLIGFESDVKYVEMLYTTLRLHFANTLEPQPDPTLSDKENVFRLRSAGIERGRIGNMLWGPGGGKRHLEVGRLYKEACADRGQDPVVAGRSVNAKTYRKSFSQSYVGRIRTRLWEMETSRERGTDLVLGGRAEAVAEAFYEHFPHLRPIEREDRQIGEGVTGGPGGNCSKCAKTKSGYCRDHQWLKPSRARYSGGPTSYAGMRAGRAAADSADLGGGNRGNRLEA